MSQRDVENLLGRLLTDVAFRRRFFSTPEQVISKEPLNLISREIKAVLAMDAREIAQFARYLDPRIVRTDVSRKSATNSQMSLPATPKRKLEHKRITG
jgi:hypothetical protein